MAIPRVFISSTYYDLKYIRNDIESFIKNLGYEPVLHEKNKITYTQTSSLEDSCYNEISLCDILICIIGNKYGTKSGDNDYSITMNELLNAIRDKKKIYVFIQKDVSIENNTYLRNKDLVDFKPFAADNIKIHQFIAELKTNNNNFPIQDFESVLDITNSIKDQFAGLFQNLLQNESTITNEKTYYDLVDTSNEIKNLVKSFEEEKELFFKKFDSTIFVNNPLMKVLRDVLELEGIQLFIDNKNELINFIKKMGYTDDFDEFSDDFDMFSDDLSYSRIDNSIRKTLKIKSDIFDEDGKIKNYRNFDKSRDAITVTSSEIEINDTELPF